MPRKGAWAVPFIALVVSLLLAAPAGADAPVNPQTDITAEATSTAGASVLYPVAGMDAVNCDVPSGTTFAVGPPTTVSCQAPDASSVLQPFTFTVTVVDTPVLSLPSAPDPVEATSGAGAVVTYIEPTATDLFPVTVVCDHHSGDTFPVGVTTVTCTATDANNLSSSGSFLVTVVDTTKPVLSLPSAPAPVEATSGAGAVVTYIEPTATDFFPVTVTCDHHSNDTFPVGVTTVTCTATDANHNSTVGAFAVTVTDKTPPVITVPAPIIVQADSSSGAVVAYGVTAVDLVDGPVAAACLPASGSLFVVGTTTVTCNAKDAKNNAAAPKSFTVKVTAPPVVPGPPGTPPPPTTTVPAPLLPPTLKPQPVSNFTAAPGDRRVLVSWKLPAGAGLHVELQRTTGGGSPKTIYVGAALSFADTHLQNGSTYTYSIVVVDAAGNRSNSLSEKASPKAVALVAPPAGARLTSAPTLVWVPTRKATYYNVQLYRGGRKILSIWPGSNRLALKRHWIFGGRAFTLSPGQYNWYVWPGFGPHRAQKYGSPLGNSMFQLTG